MLKVLITVAFLMVVCLVGITVLRTKQMRETFVENTCYGAAADGSCKTCDDVKNAYKKKNWKYSAQNFYQCFAPNSSRIVSNATGDAKCLDTDANGRMKMAKCDAKSNNQKWTYDTTKKTLTQVGSGKCMNIWGAGKSAGNAIGLYDCVASNPTNQQWTYTSDSQFVSPHAPGMCVDISGGAAKDGALLQLYNCKPNKQNANQTWSW